MAVTDTALSLLQELGSQGLVTLGVFVVMVYFLYKGVKFGIHMFMAGVAGGAFPFVANMLLDMGVAISVRNVAIYATAAMALYLLALVISKLKRILRTLF